MDQDNQFNYSDPSANQSGEIFPAAENTGNGPYHGGDNTVSQQPKQKPQNNMALASLIMGIIGIVTFCSCYGGLIFGSLGIIFALLSKTEDHFEGYAKAGLITSVIAIVLMLVLLVIVIALGLLSELDTGGVF